MTYALANFEPSYILHGAAAVCVLAGLAAIRKVLRAEGWRRAVSLFGVVVVFVLAPFIFYAGYSANHTTLRVDDRGIELNTAFWGGLLHRDDLDLDRARIVSLNRADADLRPTRRTGGTGLPGVKLGWFELANGHRALLALSDSSTAIHIPTHLGYDLLISPENPEQFLAALRG